MSRATTWACALLIALLLSTSHLLDGPTDIETAQAVAADLAQAEQSAIDSVAAPALSTGLKGEKAVFLASSGEAQP